MLFDVRHGKFKVNCWQCFHSNLVEVQTELCSVIESGEHLVRTLY